MSIAEVRNIINGVVAEAAQLQAFLRTIDSELGIIIPRTAETGEGSAHIPAGVEKLILAQTTVGEVIEHLEKAKESFYAFLDSSE